MNLKRLLKINALYAMLLGLGFAFTWWPVASLFADFPITDETPLLLWQAASFARLLGILLFSLGLVLWVLRSISDAGQRQGLTAALFLSNLFIGLIALLQQLAIWSGTGGWVFTGIHFLLSAGYGWLFIRQVFETLQGTPPERMQVRDSLEDLQRIHFVTQNYYSLQGLRALPLGLFFLALAAGWLGEQGNCTYSLPALLTAILLWFLIGAYYQRKFGRVKARPGNPLKGFLISVAAFAVIWLASLADYSWNPPVSLFGLTMALGLVILWLQHGYRQRVHYLVLGIAVAGISLLPLAGVSSGSEIIQPPGTNFNLLLAAILVISGLLDHQLLITTFNAVKEASHG